MIQVHLSSHFHQYTKGQSDTTVDAQTIEDVMRALDLQFPGLRFRMVDEQDRIRPHINVFIGNEKAGGLADKVSPDKEVHVLGALSGG
jgi:molybdopterin synthase sulfur carrier subunit